MFNFGGDCNNGMLWILILILICGCGNDRGCDRDRCGNNNGIECILPLLIILCCCGGFGDRDRCGCNNNCGC